MIKKDNLLKFLKIVCVMVMIFPYHSLSVYAENKIDLDTKSKELYENSYEALTNRISERGYAPTSTTGAYPGMFVRDSSIQIMAHNIYGDTHLSRKLLNYLLSYHVEAGSLYASHVLKNFQDESYDNTYISEKENSDEDNRFYDNQNDYSIGLYLINGPKHGGGATFIPKDNVITSISAYLTKSTNNDKVIAKIYKNIKDEKSVIATTEYIFGENASGWQKITFDNPVNVTSGEKYYLSLQASEESGNVVWYGSTERLSQSQNGWNYDTDALNGWGEQGVFPAFKIHSDYAEIDKGYYIYQGDSSTALYRINADVNKAGQEFVPRSKTINGIKAYLTKSTNQDKVIAQICTDIHDPSSVIAQTIYTFGNNENGWQNIMFDESVTVKPGQKYYLILQATKESGTVLWYGTTTHEDGVMNSWNYDSVAIGGWLAMPQYPAFSIISDIDMKHPIEIAQPFKVKGNKIESISVEVEANDISGKLVLDIREDYKSVSTSIKKVTTEINRTGKQIYDFKFNEPIQVEEGKTYYAVLTATDSKGDVKWTYKQGSKANSYLYSSQWSKIGYDFNLDIYPEVSGNYKTNLISLSNDMSAWQEIPNNGEIITGVKVILGKTKDTKGQIKATLYKGYGDNAQVIDSDIVDAKKLNKKEEWITFKFGLPLEKTKSGNYYLKLETMGVEDHSIFWYGANHIDNYQTIIKQDNKEDMIISGEASFEALRSKIGYIDSNMQTDANYILIHAWAQYVNSNKGTQEDKEFIKKSYPIISQFANYYLDHGYFNKDLKLLRNPAFEHSREGRMWNAYDIQTNAFASQALYELSEIALAMNDKESFEKWNKASKELTEGINNELITEVDGIKIYAELYDASHNMRFVKGISWVNWGPMAAQWYGMDKDIMQNTYNIYQKYATIKMYGYNALSSEVLLGNDNSPVYANIIGKGFAWEMMFNHLCNNEDKLKEMLDIECATSKEVGNSVYPESWWGEKTLSDPGNQEHCGWQVYAMSCTFPQLTKRYAIQQLHEVIEETSQVNEMLYTEDSITLLTENINKANQLINVDSSKKADIDKMLMELNHSIELLKYKKADYTKVNEALTKVEKLNKDDYIDFSQVEKAVNAVVKDLKINDQNKVDAMAKAIEDAIAELEKKPVKVTVDKAELEKIIKEAKEIDTSLYTKESLDLLNVTIQNAEKVLKDENANEKDVQDAKEKLQSALDKLIQIDNNQPSDPKDPVEDKPSQSDKEPQTPVKDDKIDKDVLGDKVKVDNEKVVENNKKDSKKSKGAKTDDPFVIIPYTILTLCALGAYITIKKFDYK